MTEFVRPKADPAKCRGCGHRLSRHTRYVADGRNRHGATLVCTADNCREWMDCRWPEGDAGEGARP